MILANFICHFVYQWAQFVMCPTLSNARLHGAIFAKPDQYGMSTGKRTKTIVARGNKTPAGAPPIAQLQARSSQAVKRKRRFRPGAHLRVSCKLICRTETHIYHGMHSTRVASQDIHIAVIDM